MDEKEGNLATCHPTIHNSVKIFTVIAGKSCEWKEDECVMSPSEYMKQISMSTQEKIDYLLKPGRVINIRSLYDDVESRCFKVSPRVVLFQQFIPGNTYSATLTIRNMTKVSRHLKLSRDTDPFFSVEFHGSNYSTTVAPGLLHVYNVRFTPAERRDYEYRVKFVNDTDVFTVPVIAIGARPILDIPDWIEIPATAVKISSSKTILVRNVGDAQAIFNFYADNSCFSVEPSRGVLEVEETMQFTVTFLSEKSGDFKANLFLNYESGEKLCLALQSSSINCTIRIDRGSIRIEDTYLGMSRSKNLTIHNRSDYIVRYQWMRFKDKNIDIQKKEEYKKLFQLMRNTEEARCVNLVHYNICLPDIHELVCQRIYADEITSLMNEKFRYNHMSFLLIPEEGEIWPQSSADITVIFQAMEVGEMSSIAYLEVTGREDRISLNLYGTGKGPVLRLNVVTIDLNNIYLCSVHNYEIIATNKGRISGTLVYKETPTDFGGVINITPSALTLDPKEYKSFNLSFSSNRKGEFVERIDFVIKESLEVVSLHIRGCIIYPTLHFDKSSLDFGTTAFGFSKEQEVGLLNLSLVPASFNISVTEDGDQCPLTYEEFAGSEAKPSFPANPREFTIIPEKGIVQAQSSLKLKVIYTPNVVRTGSSNVRVDMWDLDSDPIILPISFRGGVPYLTIKPTEISIRFSFINFSYSRSITVENNSDLDGYFYIIPQAITEDDPIVYSMLSHQGFLKARQSKTIEITIITRALGKQRTALNMLTMGEQAPVTSCTIMCNGQGPVISVQPVCLDFEETQLLQEKIMNFCMINDSPIPAQYKITSDKKNPPWFVEPTTGELGPNESAEVKVTIFLRDAGKYAGVIIVRVINSRSIPINVAATGVGCSIVFEPQIFPIFDMGFLFGNQSHSRVITMKNFGTRNCQIMWCNDPEIRIQRNQVAPTKFQVEPVAMEVPANGFNEVQCKICWDANETATEDWYIFGQIHGQGRRGLLGSSTFKATFTEPRVAFNKKELTFSVDVYPNGETLRQTDELIVTNQSRLNLNVQLCVDAPFYLTNEEIHVNRKKIILTDGVTMTVPVEFSPHINTDDPYSRNYKCLLWIEYDEHPNKDKIRCKGAVNFPNITLLNKDLIINCVSGSSAEETLRLTNNGPVPVMYKFLWAGETIEIQREPRDIEFTDSSELQTKFESVEGSLEESHKLNSHSCREKENSENYYESVDGSSAKTLASPISSDSEMPIVTSCSSCLTDLKIFAPTNTGSESPGELLDNILDIVPHEATVVPYSSRFVRFIFHGCEPMRVKVIALCEILRGPTEIITVNAYADAVRYSVDKSIIDFGQQLFGELCRSSFTLENRSAISLKYRINEKNLISDVKRSGPAISALTIEPNKGFIDPLSSMKIDIEFQPMLLGAFEIEFELQVAHLAPYIITAKGVIGCPQVYPCISRDIFDQHSVELGYQAIRLLTPDYIAMKREMKLQCNDANNDKSKNQVSEEFENILLDDRWVLVSPGEIFPSVIDIEMSIDRFIATRFIRENASVLMKHPATFKRAVIPFLYTPEYIIDMSYITIDCKTCYSTTIINYGPWNAKIAMRKLEKKQLENFGIYVPFKKILLKVGETTSLDVTWQPTSAKYTERSTAERHTVHLETSRGCTIPIVIKGIITYPFVTVNAKSLDFQNVIVGECLMMNVLVKNEGFVDCRWKAKITTTRKIQKDCSFRINYKSDPLLPGYSEVIGVYFKPRKTCIAEAKLKIVVEMGLEMQTVTLRGRGIEHELRISDVDINFLPTIPFAKVQEKIFTIENVCDHPVEFFWHHLDGRFLEEKRVAEALTRYYGVKEILLPPRKLGERMPAFLIEFYNSLMNEMAYALSAEAIEEGSIAATNDVEYKNEMEISARKNSSVSKSFVRQFSTREKSGADSQTELNFDRSKRKNSGAGYSSSFTDALRGDFPITSIFSEPDLPCEPPVLSTSDPEEIQNLLLCYIETLRQDPSFSEKMRDPVKDLFDSVETKSISELDLTDSLQPAKKVCIIFHGAPFTEYQETACKSAKILKVPLLCLNNVITEGIALGNEEFSIKLRRIIDDAYREYLSAAEKYNETPETKITEIEEDSREIVAKEKSLKQTKSPKAIKSDPKVSIDNYRYSESDVSSRESTETELTKIPREQDLIFLDPVSLYECKIQTILQLQKILSCYATVGSTKDKGSEKNIEKSRDDSFLGIEIGLLIEVLRERLSSPDFKSGFVLQTLNNIFFKSNITTLLTLLSIVGYVEYSLFVTFLNSTDNYIRKMEELRELKAKELAEEINKKIQEIDEMSLSEYELLPEDEKKFYLELTLPRKKQEALQRRTQFVQRITELRRKKKLHQRSLNANVTRNKKINKIMKNGKINSPEEKSQTSKAFVSKKEIRDRKEIKSGDDSKPRKEETSKELENITSAMNNYYSDLSAIENIIKNWDPLKKNASFMTKNKTKIDKPRDKNSDVGKEQTYASQFHIWYINATDPWNRIMYDVVVNQMNENSLAKKALPVSISSKLDLEPRRYYILKPKDIKRRDINGDGTCQIVSLSTMPDSKITTINSSDANVINKQENPVENSVPRKKRSRFVNKTEDIVSLNTSTIESKNANALEVSVILEEVLKPQWILRANEGQKFKIRYQPEVAGTHSYTYALSIIDGTDVTYDINIRGIVDIPRLDMDPHIIFSKIEERKINDMNEPTYFSNTGTYDFGSLLAFRKDKSVHRCETIFKFCNISKIDAEVCVYLQENIPDIFIMEREKLYIPAGQCESLKISAGVTKLGSFTDKLHICIANNPHINTIELRCSGSKLNIELEDKQLSFGQVLLYRRKFLTRVIRNKSPVPIFWHLTSDEILDPQLSFIPLDGMVKAWDDQTIEFSYHANKIGIVEVNLTFKAFLQEGDAESVFAETVVLSGETYDIAVDINDANPIDLKWVRVGFPTNGNFSISNRGNYEVRYVIFLEEQDTLAKMVSNLSIKPKEDIEISPASGSILPQKEAGVQITFLPKNEITLKECPILRCHLFDANKQAVVVAEFPLTVSLIAYYTRFRVYPYPEMNFTSLGVCTKKTMYLNVENTGQYPFSYSIQTTGTKHPTPVAHEIQTKKEDLDKMTDTSRRKDKKSSRSEKSNFRKIPENKTLKIGPFTIMKTEDDVQVGEVDTIVIECYPELVGFQEEQIMILVPDSLPEDRDGKLITLSVHSCIPSVDFQDLDAMFHENYVIDSIQDFVCPKGIGAHTVFARDEKCLYFRYVSVYHVHTTCFTLYNRNVIPADMELTLLSGSFTPANIKPDTFAVTPERERIPSMDHKRFTVSFNPTFIETCHAVLEIATELPSNLKDGKFFLKLVGEACVPMVTIVEPPSSKCDRTVLNFGRVLVDDVSEKKYAFRNIGVIPAKVIVEIYEDPNSFFTLSICDNKRDLASGQRYEADVLNDRRTVVCLMPEETASFEVKFGPRATGKYDGQMRLFIADNPYEKLTTDLTGEAYAELIVLEGLELTNLKSNLVNERRESNFKIRRASSKSSVVGASTSTTLPISLAYKLDYGYCFVNKIYRKNFKIVNKSANQYLRFQWSTHPNVVFSPSIGHLKYLTCKEIVATFLSSEPTSYIDTRLDCTVCSIELADSSKELCWDDRQTEVRWMIMNSDVTERETNTETFATKAIEPVNEPSHEIVAGTIKCIQVLLNATVAFSKFSCIVKEFNFEDTLMFQIREHVFTFSNGGTVDVEYMWQINMDEQYPVRFAVNYSRSTPRSLYARSLINSSKHETRKLSQCNQNHTTEINSKDAKLNRRHEPSRENDVERKSTASVYSPTDLFSSSAGLTERSSDSWLESDDLPFGIYPEKGILSPGESVECILRFSPMDVFDYKAYLTCKVENLDPNLSELIIPITGRSLLPYCHFDIPESDYLSGDRRDAKLPGPVDYQAIDGSLPKITKVIELDVVGIDETHVKEFRMINPTSNDYHFTWKDRTRYAEGEIPNFHCVLPEGIAERGKQVDFTFTFFAENVGTFESFWLFSIEKYNLECLFLFVAIVREPSIYCPLVHLRMKPTVLGVNIRESISIINDEEFQIPFQIARDSLCSTGHLQNLQITPMNGILDAKGEQILWIEYQPTLVGESQFSVKCIVKRMKIPLTIFVTTLTYDIVVSVIYVDRYNQVMQLNQHQENIIDCGKLILKAPVTLTFEITNSSKMAIYYSWDLGITPEIISRNLYSITMPDKKGRIISESRANCGLAITALKKTVIKNHPVLLKISRGMTYRLTLNATANRPFLKFSFNCYDFGPCYIRDVNAAPYIIDLHITNLDNVPYILECKFEEKPHISANLDVLSEGITAGSSVIVPIKFQPLDETHYRDTLHFVINSTIEKRITITGEGITHKIRLVNPRNKSVDLGNLSINKTTSKKLPVINDGRAAVELKFNLMENLPGFEKLRERIRGCAEKIDRDDSKKESQTQVSEKIRSDDTTGRTTEPDLSEVLEIKPAGSMILQPGKIANILVKYKPMRRMRPFVAKVAFQSDSMIQPLFILRGSCIGAEFRLSRTRLPFGVVVQGCLSEAKITLLNTGDIGSRFKWDTSKLPRDFSIAPATGYCSPGMDVNFIVSFRPTRHDSLIEGDALLEMEKYDALRVKITGGGCKLPSPVDTLFFSCRVREKSTRSVNVENDTATSWKLKPEIIGDYFTIDEVLHVPAKKSAACTIVYGPSVMNSKDNLHKSTLLLKLPDDKAPLVYSLEGLSLAPQVLQRITRQFPAKTKYTELLSVYNWMDRQQRFECNIENLNLKDPAKDVEVYTFVGNSKIDVPANNRRDYRAEFYCYKESNYNFKITFINQEGEYQFYELQYKVTKPEEIESIKLVTSVRSPLCYTLRLDNPLKELRIVYTAKCQHPSVTIHDVPKIVAPGTSETIGIEYHPIYPSDESVTKLDVSCEELGLFPYELRLKTTPAPAEKITRVDAMLGSSVTFPLTISNLTKKTAVFFIEVNNECFVAPRNVEVPALKNISFDVIYEPCNVDNVFATLTATSKTAGEFVFPLVGTCFLPKPQGPYTVTPNTPALISFKNIFRETKSFEFVLDDPKVFAMKTSLENVKQKQVVNIAIHLKDKSNGEGESENDNYATTGKLLIYCSNSKVSHINWIYYLKAVYN